MGKKLVDDNRSQWVVLISDGDTKKEVWRGYDFSFVKAIQHEQFMFAEIELDIRYTEIDGLCWGDVEGYRFILYPVYSWKKGDRLPKSRWKYVVVGGIEEEGDVETKSEAINRVKNILIEKLLGGGR